MPRPSIAPGKTGKPSFQRINRDGVDQWRASCRYRDRADSKTRTLSAYGRTKSAAENSLDRAVERALDRFDKAERDADASRLTARDWLLVFQRGLQHADDWKRKTIADYRTTVSAMLGDPLLPLRTRAEENPAPRPRSEKQLVLARHFDTIGDKALPTITSANLKDLLRNIAGTNGPGTATRVRAILSHVWETARDGDAGVDNIVRTLKDNSGRKVIPAGSKRATKLDHGRAPTSDEAIALVAALRADPTAGPMTGSRKNGVNGKDVADLTEFLFATGCRLGEALAIEWRDLTLTGDEPEVSISKTLVYVPGEGVIVQRDDVVTGKAGTKTKAGARSIPFGPSIITVLRARMRMQGIRPNSSRPVFGSPQRPDQYRDPVNCRAAIRTLFSNHGVEWGRSHIGRKHVVNYLLANGATVDEVARVLGWSSLATIDQYVDTKRKANDKTRALLAR